VHFRYLSFFSLSKSYPCLDLGSLKLILNCVVSDVMIGLSRHDHLMNVSTMSNLNVGKIKFSSVLQNIFRNHFIFLHPISDFCLLLMRNIT